MKKYGLLTALALGLFVSSSAAAQPIKGATLTPRVFLGGIGVQDDSGNFVGELEANNPKCVLTVPAAPHSISSGIGPNGSLLLTGSKGCAGSFQLFLSGNSSSDLQFGSGLPITGGIGTNTGIYSGAFVIVDAPDSAVQGTTVEWAGTYTEVFNVDPNVGGCASLSFCTGLPSGVTVEGRRLYVTLELNAFTWSVTTRSH